MNKYLAKAGVASLALLSLAAFALTDRVKDDPLAATGCAVFGLAFLLGIFWVVALYLIIVDQADDVERLRGDREAAWRRADEYKKRAEELERRLLLRHACKHEIDYEMMAMSHMIGSPVANIHVSCSKCEAAGTAHLHVGEEDVVWGEGDEEGKEGDNK